MKTIRLVGISPLEKEMNKLSAKPVPAKLKSQPNVIIWTFIRLKTDKACKAHFEKGCGPENYWAGALPPRSGAMQWGISALKFIGG